MKPQITVKTRTMMATQSDFAKVIVLNNLVLLVGLVVLIMSVQIVSGF